jgi:polyhydroxybutyrate depolymerase
MRRGMWTAAAIGVLTGSLLTARGGEGVTTQVLAATETLPATTVAAAGSARVDQSATTTAAPATTAPATTVPAPATTVPAPVTTAPATTAPAPATTAPVRWREGTHQIEVATAEGTRRAMVVVPADSGRPRSMLVVLHGVGGRGAAMRDLGFEPLALPAGTVLVYPDGMQGAWNDGRPGMDSMWSTPPDDVAFLRSLIQLVTTEAGVDRRRVALAGFSNGAIMASRLACDGADVVSAIALVGGAGGGDYNKRCQASRALPVLVVSGTGDVVVPYAGGKVADFGGRRRGTVASVAEVLAYWAARSGCSGLAEAPGPTSTVVEVSGQACLATPVRHLRMVGGGHEWHRSAGFDTTRVVWDFVRTSGLA